MKEVDGEKLKEQIFLTELALDINYAELEVICKHLKEYNSSSLAKKNRDFMLRVKIAKNNAKLQKLKTLHDPYV